MDPNLAIILSGAAAFLSAYLRGAGLSKWANAAIALVALVISAGAVILLTTGFSGSLKDDTTLFLAVAVGLATKEFIAILGYIQDAQSPLAKSYDTMPLVAAQSPVTRRASLRQPEE